MAPVGFNEKSVITMRVWPTDLDFLWHVNNGVYFSLMDFGRWNMVFRNGLFDLVTKKGWYVVVAGETIKFKKSLELWEKFELHTETIGHDERYFFIQQKFMRDGELIASGIVKTRFLKRKGGTVPVQDVLDLFKDKKLNNRAEALSHEWYGIESKYL